MPIISEDPEHYHIDFQHQSKKLIEIEDLKNALDEGPETNRFVLNHSLAVEFSSEGDHSRKISKHAELGKKTELSAKDGRLTYVPARIFQILENLNKLDLSGNMLFDLPKSILNLKNLELLNLSRNHFSELPDVICGLHGLKELISAGSRIYKLPSNLGDLEKLEKLDLSENQLKYLPDSCYKMDQVKTLNISKNQYKKVPNCLQRGLINLETLDVSMNLMMNLNNVIYSKNLREFHAKEMFYKSFPTWIFSETLSEMDIIECENCRIQNLNFDSYAKRKIIKKLILRCCSLSSTQLEKILLQVEGVTCLDLGNTQNGKLYANSFWDLPLEALATPETLTELNLELTGISEIPTFLANFINLKILNLSRNNINWLPEEISRLENLETLIINENRLIMLPEDIGSMKSLTSLKLCYCSVKTLPTSISKLKNLKYLDLYSNEMNELPEQLESLENLNGLDLEQNYFSTDDIQVSPKISYQDLRKNMRYIDEYDPHRFIGMRFDTSSVTPVSTVSSMSSGSNWASYSNTASIENLTVDEYFEEEEEEEDWNIDNDFDAENPQAIFYPTRYSFFRKNPMYFCPADYHTPRVKDQLEKERQSGYAPKFSPVVEGQFDDADEDE